nr:MAG TPA: hypothetical protein [Caudoviricetes sp.]
MQGIKKLRKNIMRAVKKLMIFLCEITYRI